MSKPSDAPRVVIDTNLVLSALVFAQGRVTPLRRAWQNQQIQPLVSKTTAAELIRVLQYPKFKLSADDQQELLADYLPYCQTIVIPEPPPVTPECRDKFDVPFLQLALAGEAHVLITGDQDLLCLATSFTCPILTAEQFLQTLTS
ncbi:putative toxin-antitoxin system toxin component, PIN family [Methylomonas sp. EFPC1]|uniref:putative toxin-antitoxin system toxin component, PIN family n=1 Tax=Methylomonas sp. EFPC1 TaxID=2812647 RepID=UPI0019671E2D|nr:putative toxin-antitoxin system toxin component, PIN family [Methylomonas sp. EFPC1]QSB02304.1 putative toxin-antitoxin system toxin component, PIN family [Methylomonas sp. EFPC1]